MPHAALWVVQLYGQHTRTGAMTRFNAARGFVGGATQCRGARRTLDSRFNAARGFVGGATFKRPFEG